MVRMANAMLILLAAYRVPELRSWISPDILSLGRHLDRLLTCWMQFPGGPPSPSVKLGIHLIQLAAGLIHNEHDLSLGSRRANQNSAQKSPTS
jgi:hypothetical protein